MPVASPCVSCCLWLSLTNNLLSYETVRYSGGLETWKVAKGKGRGKKKGVCEEEGGQKNLRGRCGSARSQQMFASDME